MVQRCPECGFDGVLPWEEGMWEYGAIYGGGVTEDGEEYRHCRNCDMEWVKKGKSWIKTGRR